MHLRVRDGQIDYPFQIPTLRRENPGVSFPKQMPNELLAEWGVYPVEPTDRPEMTPLETCVEAEPQLIDGVWKQSWNVIKRTPPQSVTAAQIRIFLHKMGMLEGVEAKIASMSKEAQIAWEYSTEVQRASPLLEEVAEVFQLKAEQIDQFFIEASYL